MGEKKIGVLGGMGPEATADLYLKLIKATPAKVDQEHLRVIIESNPKIPDRTAAILQGGTDPLPLLVDTAHNLIKAGADFIIIPCNTAHYYLARLQEQCSVPILNMLAECAAWGKKYVPDLAKVGLLATKGTIATGLYHNAFRDYGVEVLIPDAAEQEQVMEVIYKVKAGCPGSQLKESLLKAAQGLLNRGVQALVLGCTELPLVLQAGDAPVPVLDPTDILARRAVAYARGEEVLA
ncbi:MAG: aspartate/glutamate racemase family protein [bacterium]|jgi:aspartate racemase